MLLNYQRIGEGPPVVILHGLFGSLDNWHTVSKALSSRFSAIVCDLRNHGRSPHHPEMDYPAMAGDVASVMEREGLTSAHFVGHSLGGKVAMEFALEYPAAVSKLVIVDIAPRAYPPVHQGILDALQGFVPETIVSRSEAEKILAPKIPDVR